MPTRRRSRSAPVAIFWTRVDRPPRADEVTQHQFGKAHSPTERQESNTATSAGPTQTHAGSRGPLVVTALAVPAHSTHVMVRARIAAKPASRGSATAGVGSWECPLCRRFLSPTSSPVNLRQPRASRARRGRSCALNLATPIRPTTTAPTFLLRPTRSSREAPSTRRAGNPDGALARAELCATWWCAVSAAIPPTCASSRGWSPASRQTWRRPKPASKHCPPSQAPQTPATPITAATRHDVARSRSRNEPSGSKPLANDSKGRFTTMPPATCDPRSRRNPVGTSLSAAATTHQAAR